jgi:hypothetical protein
MKRKKLAKEALRHPELFSNGELAYFEMWLRSRKEQKEKKKLEKKAEAQVYE